MAKIYTSGIIQSIRGKLGDLTFSAWKGIPVVKKRHKKVRQRNSKLQIKTRDAFTLFFKKWRELSFAQRALWENYAKQIRKPHNPSYGSTRIIRGRRKETMTGTNAYIGMNAMLTLCGFSSVDTPPNRLIPKPSPPSTDLPIYSHFKNAEFRFKIWLPIPNPCKCRARVYIRVAKRAEYPYTAVIAEISTSPTEIVIDKIKLHRKRKIVEVPINKIKELELGLQMRTIADNGNYSMSSAIYKIKLSNSQTILAPH